MQDRTGYNSINSKYHFVTSSKKLTKYVSVDHKVYFYEDGTKFQIPPLLLYRKRQSTLPTAEILSGKNAREWVSMVLYLKNK